MIGPQWYIKIAQCSAYENRNVAREAHQQNRKVKTLQDLVGLAPNVHLYGMAEVLHFLHTQMG